MITNSDTGSMVSMCSPQGKDGVKGEPGVPGTQVLVTQEVRLELHHIITILILLSCCTMLFFFTLVCRLHFLCAAVILRISPLWD